MTVSLRQQDFAEKDKTKIAKELRKKDGPRARYHLQNKIQSQILDINIEQAQAQAGKRTEKKQKNPSYSK